MDEQTRAKLDEIHDEVRAVHSRHDHNDQRVEHLHGKMDRMRRLVAALWKADGKAFMEIWRGE
jgi:hypothetical protein